MRVVSDDNEDEYADDEASLLLASEEKVEIIIEQDRPWWIKHSEDWFVKLVMPILEANNQVAAKDGSSDRLGGTSTVNSRTKILQGI